jgi:hypothetical protein
MQGLSHCFKKAEDGRLADVMVIEPIASSSLECMATGKPHRLETQEWSASLADQPGGSRYCGRVL